PPVGHPCLDPPHPRGGGGPVSPRSPEVAPSRMAKSKPKSDGTPLVIVESPAKAKTIGKFLGKGFLIEASIGHVRDLPSSAREIPAAQRGEKWARLGIDIENDYRPLYVVPTEKREQMRKLKALLKKADLLYL